MNSKISYPKYEVKYSKVSMMVLLFIFLPPFIGLPLAVYAIWNEKYRQPTDYYLFFACLAVYFASINATKAPAGDQVQYFVAYNNVPQIGFIKSLIYIYGINYYRDPTSTTISGEFMNGIYNYIGYYITFGQYYLFVFIYTFVEYMLVYIGLYKFCQNLKRPHFPIVCGVMILSFFYLYFQYLLQIQKQFLAQSIMMYVMGNLSLYGKMNRKLWTLTAISLFTHASVILFVPFLILGKLRRPLDKKSLFSFVFLFMLLVYLGPKMVGNITSVDSSSSMMYSVGRVANAENDNDGGGIVLSQVIVVGIPIALILIKQLWFNRKRLLGYSAFILNVVLLLLVAVAAMFRQTIAQYRYFMMIFAFMPFVYPFAFNCIKRRNLFLKALSVVMLIWFYLKFEFIIYDFAPEWAIITIPPSLLTFMFNPGL